MASNIRKIAVLTSGGDAPGMNAAIRSVVRTAINEKLLVVGISHGYKGLINKEFSNLFAHSVSNIIQRGGTFLKSSRCPEFKTTEGLAAAYQNLKDEAIDALVVIGGDGTFRGAQALIDTYDFPVIGLPGTIDNDLFGTDATIGYDTALNTVVQAVDKIRDTADSHDTLFFVEVMGRDAGFIALNSGISCGAEGILIPESATDIDHLIEKLKYDQRKRKTSGIIIVAEGEDLGGANEVAKLVQEHFPNNYQTRVTILGHIQRGGSPTCADRVLASRLGYYGVLSLMEGHFGVMMGVVNNKIVKIPFEKAVKQHQSIDKEILTMAQVLSI